MVAPYSPCLMTSALGPRVRIFRAARTRLFSGEQLGFAVVDQQNIDFLQGFQEFGALDVDPEIHGVAADQGYARHLAAHVELQLGLNVGEEEKL